MNDETRSDPSAKDMHEEPPHAQIRRHGWLTWMWLIPAVAAALVAYLVYTTVSTRGPVITLTMSSAEDLEVDQTQVKHKAVPLGKVEDIHLSKDMSHVVVRIRMNGSPQPPMTDHARFWVVRPRLSAGNLTGIETLVSGAYIEVDPGAPGGKPQRDFQALDQPPGRQSDEPGHVFVLKATHLGSISAGAPIFYRDVSVGEVLSYDLGDGLGPVSLRVFVRAPYDHFVHQATRFWIASGLSLTMGPEGMHLELESIQALLSGGIAFETPPMSEGDGVAEDGAAFELYDDKASADAAFFHENIPYVTYFKTSVQGLSRGSPVLLYGVQVGNVSDVKLAYDGETQRMVARVAFQLQPERVLTKKELRTGGEVPDVVRQAFVSAKMRVMLESSNFLTGAKDLSLAYTADIRDDLPRENGVLVLPSEGAGIDSLQASLADIANKVDKIPFEQIGKNANDALASIQRLATNIDTNATPALAQLPGIAVQMSQAAQNVNGALGPSGYGQNSAFQHGMVRLLDHLNDTARSFRVLADYLDRHPEALIRGRAAQPGEK
jgi:paraquat-inducible protein B